MIFEVATDTRNRSTVRRAPCETVSRYAAGRTVDFQVEAVGFGECYSHDQSLSGVIVPWT
jgi:hypothetical protein